MDEKIRSIQTYPTNVQHQEFLNEKKLNLVSNFDD